MSDKRILIISNNCLSEQNSNGRTMLNLVRAIPKENIAQIYTSGEIADNQYCGACLRITNREAVNSYLKKPKLDLPEVTQVAVQTTKTDIGGNKTAATMLLRDLVWDNSPRLKKSVIAWAKEQRPDYVVLQLGDASLLISLAILVCKKLNIPLITYNTEDYYFKQYDFMSGELEGNAVYNLFHRRFCKIFDKMMSLNPICVYNCEGLKKLYNSKFNTDSLVIYCGTSFNPVEEINENGLILYSGNLGVGRHKPIIEIGDALQKISKELFVDVYGSATETVAEELNRAIGVRYHGLVSYEENCCNIRNSKLLVHVESFDDYYKVDTKYAFSTKLADYCASGIPIFSYAPEESESARYLKANQASCVATDIANLYDILKQSIVDNDVRKSVSENAVALYMRNHQVGYNEKQFTELLK